MQIKRLEKGLRPELDLIQFFHNDVTLSIGYGSGHYCDGHFNNPMPEMTETMEVAVWRTGNDFEPMGNDSVAGYVPVNLLSHLLNILETSSQAEKEIADFLKLQFNCPRCSGVGIVAQGLPCPVCTRRLHPARDW